MTSDRTSRIPGDHSLRAVIYVRVSTDEQALNGTSLEMQRRECAAVAARRNAAIVRVCEDAGVSGTRFETRPGLMEALELIESGEANLLIVLKLDRLARSLPVTLQVAERIDRAGGRLVTADDQELGGTTSGRMMLGMMASVSQFERDTIRDRTMSGRRERAMKEIMPSRSVPPYGYQIVTHRDVERGDFAPAQLGSYVVVPAKAEWVRCIYEQMSQGLSLRQIGRFLDAQGVVPPGTSKLWGASTISKMLDNPAYKGFAVWGKSQQFHDERRITEKGQRTDRFRRDRPLDQWLTIPTPPIVSEELWESCQGQLRRNKEVRSGRGERKFMLSSLLRCPTCGLRMCGQSRTTQGGKARYVCQPHKRSECRTSVSASLTDASVVGGLLWAAEHPATIEESLKAFEDYQKAGNGEAVQGRLKECQSELKQLETRERATVEAQIQAISVGASGEMYLSLLGDISRRREVLAKQIAELTPRRPRFEPAPKDEAFRIASVIRAMEIALTAPSEDYTPAEKQTLLALIVESVVPTAKDVEPEGVEIQLRTETVHTITAAFLRIVHHRLRNAAEATASFDAFQSQNGDLFEGIAFLLRFYDKATLVAPDARTGFVPPDRELLP